MLTARIQDGRFCVRFLYKYGGVVLLTTRIIRLTRISVRRRSELSTPREISLVSWQLRRRSKELTQKTEDDMMKVRNLGKKSLDEVKKKLEELGLSLRPSEE